MTAGHSYTCFTPETSGNTIENYAWFYALGESFEFKLQTCSSATIVLAVTPLNQNTDGYRISLGSESTLTRLHHPDRTASANTDKLLDCYILRSYWVTWFGGVVAIGYGKSGTNKLIELRDSDVLTIAALSLFTPMSQGGGEWQISRSKGTYCAYCSGQVDYLIIVFVSLLGMLI